MLFISDYDYTQASRTVVIVVVDSSSGKHACSGKKVLYTSLFTINGSTNIKQTIKWKKIIELH